MLFSLFFVVIFFLNKRVVIVIAAGEMGRHYKKLILSSKLKNYAPVFLLFFTNIFLFSSYFFWWKNPFFLFFWPTYVLGTVQLDIVLSAMPRVTAVPKTLGYDGQLKRCYHAITILPLLPTAASFYMPFYGSW